MSELVHARILAMHLPGSASSIGEAQVRVRVAETGSDVAVSLVCGFPVGAIRPPNMALLHTVGER